DPVAVEIALEPPVGELRLDDRVAAPGGRAAAGEAHLLARDAVGRVRGVARERTSLPLHRRTAASADQRRDTRADPSQAHRARHHDPLLAPRRGAGAREDTLTFAGAAPPRGRSHVND